MERLLEAGALDVALSPIFMKKNRPGTLLARHRAPEDQERLAALLFAETSPWACAFTRQSAASKRATRSKSRPRTERCA